MRRIILLAVSSIFILSACGNNQSVITETKVEENIIGEKGTNKEKEDSAFEDIGLVKKDRADGNGKVWTEIQGDKEKEYTDEYNLNKQEKARLEAKADASKQGEFIAIAQEMNGKKVSDFTSKYGFGNTELIKNLAGADQYTYYKDGNIYFTSKEEITKLIQKAVDLDDIGNTIGGLDEGTTKEIYDQLHNRKLENQHKEEVKRVDSLIIHLTNPKTVEQLGGNKVGDNKGIYKGQIQQPRKYGNSAYSGSMLVACNSMLGSNYEKYYEVRCGFIVLKAEGYSLYNSLSGTDRSLFQKTEWEVFKLNNPKIKVIQSGSNEYYNQKFDYGTWANNGEPMWVEGVNQCVVNYLGQNMFQSGLVIDGQLQAKVWHGNKNTWVDAGYTTGCSNPTVWNGNGTENQEFVNEINDFWHNSSIDHSQEAQNNIVRKYMH